MSQHSTDQRNALADRPAIDVADRLSLAVAPDCARFSLRVGADGREAAGGAFGCALPAGVGGLSRSGDLAALRLGPDEWLLLAPQEEADAIAVRFAALTTTHSLVDVSHREVGVEVRGAAAATALGAVCALDLERMPSGSTTRTIFDRAQVVLIKYAADSYRIEVWPSFAPHVFDLLAAAVRDASFDL